MKIYCAELFYLDKLIKAVYFTNSNAAMLMCNDWLGDLVIRATDGDPDANLYKVRVMDYSDRADDILKYWQVFDTVTDYYKECAA